MRFEFLALVFALSVFAEAGSYTQPVTVSSDYRDIGTAYGSSFETTVSLYVPTSVYEVRLSSAGCDDAGRVWLNGNLIWDRPFRGRDEPMTLYPNIAVSYNYGANSVKFWAKDLYGGNVGCSATFTLYHRACDGTDSSCGVYPTCGTCTGNQHCKSNACTSLDAITLSPNPAVGTSQQFTATCHYGGMTMTCPALAWSASLGAITQSGTWSAAGQEGEGTVTAEAYGIKGTATVKTPKLTAITISPPAYTGASKTFTASCSAYGTPMTCPALTWTTMLGTITPTGTWNAGSAKGKGTVTASFGTVSGSATVISPECSLAYTCERTTTTDPACTGTTRETCKTVCPAGAVISGGGCSWSGGLFDMFGLGLFGSLGGSCSKVDGIVPSTCVKTETYTSQTGCGIDKQASISSQGCGAACVQEGGKLYYKTGGTCSSELLCEKGMKTECTVVGQAQKQAGAYCEGDNVVRDDTVGTPTCRETLTQAGATAGAAQQTASLTPAPQAGSAAGAAQPTASPTPAPQKATLALSDCTTHVLAAGNNACPSGKVMAGMILGAARNNNVITCCSLTASGTKVTVNDAACSEQNILNNVPSRAGRAACNGDAFLTGVRLYMTTNQPTYAAIRCCPLSAAGSALVKSGDAVAVAPIQGTYTNCPTNYIGDGVEWVGEVGGNEDPQSDRIVCRETKTQTVPPQAQTQSAGSTTATTTISTTIGCGIESKTQKTIVQQCPNGCNPSKAECYSECRPAATKECTQNQLTGIQTCSAEGKWGECASDLSKLCRTEPKTTKFAGSTTNVRSKLETDRFLDLKTLEGFELEAPGKFSIKYATPVDVCNADIDSAVEWGDSWFSINSSKISESLTKPTKPASVTIRTTGLKEPALLYLNKPAKSYEEITATGAPCPTDRCLNVAYSPTSVSFDAAAFSSYAVAETAKQQTSIQKPVQTEMASGLVAKCPDKLIAAEEANVTVFYYENGFPKCIGGVTMSVTVGGEKTKTEYKDCKSGKHVFWVNTTLGGTYKVEAKGNGKTSECEFNSVKKKPTPTPETSEIIIALVALLAFAMARRKA